MEIQIFDPEEIAQGVIQQVTNEVSQHFSPVYIRLLRTVLGSQLSNVFRSIGYTPEQIDNFFEEDGAIGEVVNHLTQILISAIVQVVIQSTVLGQFQQIKEILCNLLGPIVDAIPGVTLAGCNGGTGGGGGNGGNGSGGGNGGTGTVSFGIERVSVVLNNVLEEGVPLPVPEGKEYEPDGKHLLVLVNGVFQHLGEDYTETSNTSIAFTYSLPRNSLVEFIIFNY